MGARRFSSSVQLRTAETCVTAASLAALAILRKRPSVGETSYMLPRAASSWRSEVEQLLRGTHFQFGLERNRHRHHGAVGSDVIELVGALRPPHRVSASSAGDLHAAQVGIGERPQRDLVPAARLIRFVDEPLSIRGHLREPLLEVRVHERLRAIGLREVEDAAVHEILLHQQAGAVGGNRLQYLISWTGARIVAAVAPSAGCE